jgi:iron(III) transport system substrate-binding protein
VRRTAAICIAIAGLAVASCGSRTGSDGLVVYSGRSEELVQPVIAMFEEATGIDVEVRYASSPELAATLLAEGDATRADVFFAQDPASLGSVAAVTSELPQEVLDLVPEQFRDTSGQWVGTSGRVRTFIYNLDDDLELPQTIDDVTGPEWAGQLGIAPTNGSFLSFVSAMILERGEEATLEWLQAIAANDPIDYPSNLPVVSATDNGEIEGGLVNHYYLLQLRAEGAGQHAENWFIPAGDVGTLIMTAGAAIITGTDHPDEAREFVEFLLSQDAQHYFAEETYEYPLIEGVPPAEGLPALDEINSPDIDLSRLADVLDDATRLVAEAGLV